jgi:hypothetical protein
MKEKIFPRAVAYAGCAIFALTTSALAQNAGPTVEVTHDSKDSKTVPITQEKEPLVRFLLETGYTSEYNFRGTNLMPGSIGGYFYQIQATVPKVGPGSLTLGMWAIHQIGDASVNAWSISEGGGGGGQRVGNLVDPGPPPQFISGLTRFPTTVQTQFREFDLFAAYKFSLGPVDVTFGNIAFIIDREAQTFETWVLDPASGLVWTATGTPFLPLGPERTVTGELFDRVYIRLSTTKIPHITPSIVYYQTIYNEGDQPTSPRILINDAFGNRFEAPGPLNERNDELGGYLEGRINGNFPCGHWLDINPYGVIAASFRDRTEPTPNGTSFGGRPFTGFTHAQAGLELAFHIAPHLDFVPQAVYSHHISDPPIGTNKNEFWAGVKVAVNLW